MLVFRVKRRLAIILSLTLIVLSVPTVASATEIAEDEQMIQDQTEAYEEITVDVETGTIDSVADNDELFAKYVNQVFYGPSLNQKKLLKSSGASRLSDNNFLIYSYLKDGAAEVASGVRSSTVFEISIADLLPDSYTASDLGVTAIVDANNNITTAAQNALISKLNIDMSLVLDALLADCPYELYWFDKVTGYAWGYPSIGARNEGNGWVIYFNQSGYFTVYMAVAEDYTDDTSQTYITVGSTNYFIEADTSKTSAATAAASNARTIIEEYQSLSDLEKLYAYKDKICGLTDYNSVAATTSVAYGNPWQLIWVFDGDDDTKVVCEGYSKAFQYLCDESTFSEDTDCITVSGELAYGSSGIGHMWNVVSLDDGYHYLADITNSDAGTIGSGGGLFLTGCASGDSDSGYYFTCGSEVVYYDYDDDTSSLYTTEELTIVNAEELSKTSIATASIESVADQVYTGSEIEPILTVFLGGNKLIEDEDYTVTYANNINVGVATAMVKGIGDYKGEISANFTINPASPGNAAIGGRASSALRINWTEASGASGYIIEQNINGKWSRIARIANPDTLTYRIEQLSAYTSYRFRLRAFGFSGSTPYYSPYIYVNGTTLPKVVSGFKIGEHEENALVLNWTKNNYASGYIIEQYNETTEVWNRIARIANTDTVSYRVENLTAGSSFKFRITAFGFEGSTPIYSSYVTVSGKTLPSSVDGLKIGGRASNALRLNWTKNLTASGYIIEQMIDGVWTRIARIATVDTVTYRVVNLVASTNYQFRICSFGFDGSTPIYSSYTTINGTTLPATVTDFVISGRAKDALRLNWTKNDSASGYIIEQYQDGQWVRIARISKASTVTYCVSGLESDTTYTFRICAFGFDGTKPLYSSYTTVEGTTL